MRILLVHNYYQQSGGEDDVVDNEKDLLESRGHEIKLLTVTNDDIQSIVDRIRAGWNAAYSKQSRELVSRAIKHFSPALIHIHNFFPLLSPSIFDACSSQGVPVIQTLHNYRLICIGANLTRNTKPCELCIRGQHYWGVIHRCYRSSALASLAGVRMITTHNSRGTWASKVQTFIAPTNFMKRKYVVGGFPSEKISVKPNFVPDSFGLAQVESRSERHGGLFVGRLSPEKGVHTLLQAWQESDTPLRVIGDGPLLEYVQNAANSSITTTGWLPLSDVVKEMRRAEFLVIPSVCYEGFPVTLALSFASGLPVIASRLGSIEELVDHGKTGLHFDPGNAGKLAESVRWAVANPESMRNMGRHAWHVYKDKLSSESNYRMLMQIYESALSEVGRN